jgi:hypothetical protein
MRGIPPARPHCTTHVLPAVRSFGYNPLALPNPGALLSVGNSLATLLSPCLKTAIINPISVSHSTSHLRIPILRILIRRNPQHIVAPDQHLAEMALALSLDPLDGAAELDVHVAVDADEAARVLGLAPLEADAHVVVDERLQHWPRVHGDELWEGRVSFCGCLRWTIGDWDADVRSWLWLCERVFARAQGFWFED